MKKKMVTILLTLALIGVLAPLCFAEEVAPERGSNIFYYAMAVLGCSIGIGIAAVGSGIGMGIGTARACEGIARNPGTTGKILTTLIIGLALMESVTIYALVVVLIILFVDPFGGLLQF